ncbi:hypothetical protein HMI56_003481 [Coelomomyces lativittatus]|nr:hypothetical protein HMI56_003481 [Coelomomyces lativittatus]
MSSTPSLLTRSLKLNTGRTIPQLGYGTWQLLRKDVEKGMQGALEAGYRHFDFAMIYENQKQERLETKRKVQEDLIPTLIIIM